MPANNEKWVSLKVKASTITQLKSTIFTAPIISSLCKGLSLVLLKLIGWQPRGTAPDEAKYVLIGAPHTSNWDFVLFVLYAFTIRLDIHWMGKHTLFPGPFRRLMIWLGGIPIDRSQANSVVSQMVEYFANVDRLTVLITPEGTRSKVDRWKMGFYHIAIQAELPIYLGYIDSKTKTLGIVQRFQPTGDAEADMQTIQAFYADKVGLNPHNA